MNHCFLKLIGLILISCSLVSAYPYKLVSQKQYDIGWEFHLKYAGNEKFYLQEKNTISQELVMKISYETQTEFSVRITDPNEYRFEPPHKHPFPFTKEIQRDGDRDYSFEIKEFPFSFKIKRESTGETILDTENFDFYFTKYYIEIGFSLPSEFLYGLGERRQEFKYKPGTYTIWPLDQATIENGKPGHQLYGQHPVYLMKEKSKNFHVVYLRSWNSMDVVFEHNYLVYKIAGRGLLEFKIFLGDTKPETSIVQYHNYINGFATMPFWSMGYHQCAWGYKNSQMLLDVVNKFNLYGIPIDTIWSDIDHMQDFIDFTIDRSRFLKEDFDKIFQNDLRWVPILDIGIKISDNEAYRKGIEMNAFIKSNRTKQPLINKVWPGFTHFPDFNHPNASKYWTTFLVEHHNNTNFSGIWLDMNEISGFVDGEITKDSKEFNDFYFNQRIQNPNYLRNIRGMKGGTLEDDEFFKLPYYPGGNPLQTKTLSMDGMNENKGVLISQDEPLYQFDFHALNGFSECLNTFNAIKYSLKNPQPFVLTRSSAPGSGQFATHWTGDNFADWENLRDSISSIFNFNLFGIPMTGADICGFNSNTNEELCARWMQLGSFYPFSRNHRTITAIPHEPYAFGENSPVLETSIKNLKMRYSLLKQYYSFLVAKNGKGTLFRPLFFEFPEDESLMGMDDQFMIDSSILVSPVVKKSAVEKMVYIPKGAKFYSLTNGKIYKEGLHHYKAPLRGYIPIFQREGTILFFQDTTKVTRSSQLTGNFKLKIFFDTKSSIYYKANGYIMGIKSYDENSVASKCLGEYNCIVDIEALGVANGRYLTLEIHSKKRDSQFEIEDIQYDSIEIIGLQEHSLIQKIDPIKISNVKSVVVVDMNK